LHRKQQGRIPAEEQGLMRSVRFFASKLMDAVTTAYVQRQTEPSNRGEKELLDAPAYVNRKARGTGTDSHRSIPGGDSVTCPPETHARGLVGRMAYGGALALALAMAMGTLVSGRSE
jgi:hypothetical protein